MINDVERFTPIEREAISTLRNEMQNVNARLTAVEAIGEQINKIIVNNARLNDIIQSNTHMMSLMKTFMEQNNNNVTDNPSRSKPRSERGDATGSITPFGGSSVHPSGGETIYEDVDRETTDRINYQSMPSCQLNSQGGAFTRIKPSVARTENFIKGNQMQNSRGEPSVAQYEDLFTRKNSKTRNPNVPIRAEGSRERELHRVHFDDEIGNMVRTNSRINVIDPATLSRRITVVYCLLDGRTVTEQKLVSSHEYDQLSLGSNLNSVNGRNIIQSQGQDSPQTGTRSRDTRNYNNLCDFAGSSLHRSNDRQSEIITRGTLSWQTSDSSGSDESHLPGHGDYNSRNCRTMPRIPSPSYSSNWDHHPGMKIGRIVSSWKINFPKAEKDPDQFLFVLKDLLSTSGINKDLFVPCLSSIFEGAYRQWYLINKRNWRSWRDFSKAFRYQWGVKKADGDLFVEIRDLKVEKGESLAEFTCRARFIFERMMYPPTFKEQLKQILIKFNP